MIVTLDKAPEADTTEYWSPWIPDTNVDKTPMWFESNGRPGA